MAKKQVKKEAYTITLEVNGKKLTGVADTIEEAVLKLPKFTPKTIGKITIAQGKKVSKTIPYNIVSMNRLFYPGMTGDINRTALAKRYAFIT